MQEDLGLHGNELNYITTAWTCGYVIGQIPSNLLITRIRPSLWIPAMELLWSILTLVLASSKSFTTLVVIRFFVGLAESTFYPGMQVSTRLHVPRYRNETCYESMLLAVGIRKKN